MLNTLRFSQKFEIRIYDSPGYTVLPIKQRGIDISPIGRVIVFLFLLALLALAGSVKVGTATLIARVRHNAELIYLLTPALTVLIAVVAEDSLRYIRGIS